MGFFKVKIRIGLGNFIGRFLEYDENNRSAPWLSVMRKRVKIDVTEPLKRKKRMVILCGCGVHL